VLIVEKEDLSNFDMEYLSQYYEGACERMNEEDFK